MTELRTHDEVPDSRRTTSMLVASAVVGLAIVIASIVVDHRVHGT